MERDFGVVLMLAFLAFIVLSLSGEKKSNTGRQELDSGGYNLGYAEYSISDGQENKSGGYAKSKNGIYTRKAEIIGMRKVPI